MGNASQHESGSDEVGSSGRTPLMDPVQADLEDSSESKLESGMALCLSGGGYRAMLFHAGVLLRLNEIGYLARLRRISSVSGGSITAARLGLVWKDLHFEEGVATDLVEKVITPIWNLAGHTIDSGAILGGILTPLVSISDEVAKAYRKHLYGDATLQDLPDDTDGSAPRFIINATNVQTGALWRFSRPYMGDYRVGRTYLPSVSLAEAAAASSAFPPVLSPMQLDLSRCVFPAEQGADLQQSPYTRRAFLTDGGVYDNLGLETAWKRYRTLLVSDGGGKMQPEPAPHTDWPRHAIRVNDIIDNQVRSLRKRQLIAALETKTLHDGAYWGIRSSLAAFPHPGPLRCPPEATHALANTPTRLATLDTVRRNRLINWGYAICGASIDSHHDPNLSPPSGFPFPDAV